MKRLLVVLSIVLVLGISGCKSTSPDIVEVTCIRGLNGVQECEVVREEVSILQSVNAADDVDKSKLPTYLFDEVTQEPLQFSDVGERLKLKFFGIDKSSEDLYKVGFQTKLRMEITGFSVEELMARTVLMIHELRNYDYWLIGASEFYLWYIMDGVNYEIIVYMPSIRSDGFTLTLEDYKLENWEIDMNFTFNLEEAQALYQGHIEEYTFGGYVLDYK